MVTFTGIQSDLLEALADLVELEYDALEAYKVAVERLEDKTYKEKMQSFKNDHERHIKELRGFLKTQKVTAPDGPDAKQWLTKGKTFLGSLIGDKKILQAMDSNEVDTNKAYNRMIDRDDLDDDIKDIIERAYKDEQHHKEWIENTLNKI